MQSLTAKLDALFAGAFAKAGLDPRHAVVVESQRPDLCQFQCNGALAAAKAAKGNPRAFAEKVLEALGAPEGVRDLGLAGPGFINFSVTDAFLAAHLAAAAADARLGLPPAPPEPVFLDYGGPNVAKPLHVGHLRSAIIGEALRRLHTALGRPTLSDIHLGDWGTQMGMLIEAVRERQPGLPYFDPSPQASYPTQSPVSLDDLERLYPAMAARCKDDPSLAEKARQATRELQSGRPGYRALWRHFVAVSVEAIRAQFDALGVRFDLWLGESDSQADIPAMLQDLEDRKVSQKSEGATVVFVDDVEPKGMPPLLLVKSDGGYLYGTTDLAALRGRVAGHRPGRLLYVADKRQALHFRQVFAGAAKAGYLAGAQAEHVGFGTVNGPDGKPFKTREGGVMRLGALLDMAVQAAGERMKANGIAAELPEAEFHSVAKAVGYGAVKFADLSNHRSTDYTFDLDKFVQFEGKTGPYHLYAAVRMKAILRKAAERGFAPGPLLPPAGDADRRLMLALAAYPEALARAAELSTPHTLCDYAYTLATAFSAFYQNSSILHEEDSARRGSWLALTRLSLRTLGSVLDILGLEPPERM